MRARGRIILWPIYFDTEYSWREGRRIPKKLAIRNVKAEELLKAAEDLNLDPILNPGLAYSKFHWKKIGNISVKKSSPKTQILNDIALRIRYNRGTR
jgi:signal recognition particle subunit SRP19